MQTMYDSLEDYERDIYGLGSDSDSGDDAEKKNIECQLYQQMHYAQTSDEVDNDYTITPSDAVKLSAADSDSVVFLKSTHVPKKRKSEVIFISSDSDVQPSKKRKEEHFASLAPISETSLEQSDCKIKLDHLQMKKNKKSNKFAKKSKFRKGKESSSTPTIRISSDEESVAEWTVIDDITDPQPDLMMNVTNMWSSQQTSKTSKDWKIELEDKMNNIQNSEKKSKSHHKRYYASKSSIRCHKCGECGHLSKYCTQPRKHPSCYLCGETGHSRQRCPNALCFNCHQPGHQMKDCTERWRRLSEECYRCQQSGHIGKECPDIWRQLHLTVKYGSMQQAPLNKNKNVFCYNCGRAGHFGHICNKSRMIKSIIPMTPFICRYDNWKQINNRFNEMTSQPGKQKRKRHSSNKHKFFDEEEDEKDDYEAVWFKNKKTKTKNGFHQTITRTIDNHKVKTKTKWSNNFPVQDKNKYKKKNKNRPSRY